MALIIPSSSTVTNNSQKHYDVFLSFRGEDTRHGITSHIYKALAEDKKIKTYFDEDSLERGDEISPALLAAIERSKISLIVFSEHYATSSWCLSELVQINKCRQNLGHIVFPVFYKVDPSNVRKQDQGSYKDAFKKHEKSSKHKSETIKEWRSALEAIASISGSHYKPYDNKPESAIVKDVVETILKKLGELVVSDVEFKGLVGMKDHFIKVESLLSDGSPRLRILSIWGMGGIGKTTIAKAVSSRLSSRFESFYFLSNVREGSEKHGLERLQYELISKLLGDKNINFGILSNSIPEHAKERLRRTKVLLVLDDVSERKQLEHLVGDHFGSESRIIVTTRDEGVLRGTTIEADFKKYEVELLSLNDSLELFKMTTLRKYEDLSSKVVSCLGQNPLAITVFGSHLRSLRNPSKGNWEKELEKLKDVSHVDIQKVLRISYDGLEKLDKKIFLDIACFFKGKKRCFVENILDGCNFHASIGIDNLIDKSLVTEYGNKLQMHDLVQKMGWLIVREESEEPGERSRIWIAEEANHIFNDDTGTSKIEGIFLDTSKLDEDVLLKPEVFQRLYNLRLLKINDGSGFKLSSPDTMKHKVCVEELDDNFPRSLSYLEWKGYPLKSLPLKINPSNIVKLKMRFSKLEKLWDGIKNLNKLKCIDLSHSINLTQIPYLSRAKNLETLNLEHCTSLVEVPWDPLRNMSKLLDLNLGQCHKVGNFLDRIDSVELKTLNLSNCPNLKTVPDIVSRSLVSLKLDSTNIVNVPLSIGAISSLTDLSFNRCRLLKNLPSNIAELNCLNNLSLQGCPSLDLFPVLPMNIKGFFMSHTAIKEVPSSCFENCSSLSNLFITDCEDLEILPSNIFGPMCVSLKLDGCSNLKNLPEIPNTSKSNLRQLFLSQIGIRYLPLSMKKLTSLRSLSMNNCKNLEFVDDLSMSSLQNLSIVNCKKLDASQCTNSLEMVTDSTLNEFRSRFWDKPRKVKPDTFCYSPNTECLKLDQSSLLTQFQLRVLDNATLRYDFPHDSRKRGTIITQYSGEKIPEWFNHRPNKDSPTSIIVVPCPGFLGFALCAIISGNSHCNLDMECKINLKNGDLVFKNLKNGVGIAPGDSNQVVMWYPYTKYNMYPDTADEVTFEFSVIYLDRMPHNKIRIECGVHVVCWNDLVGLGLPDPPPITTPRIVELESDTDSLADSVDETCSHKRNKENDDDISSSPLKKQRF